MINPPRKLRFTSIPSRNTTVHSTQLVNTDMYFKESLCHPQTISTSQHKMPYQQHLIQLQPPLNGMKQPISPPRNRNLSTNVYFPPPPHLINFTPTKPQQSMMIQSSNDLSLKPILQISQRIPLKTNESPIQCNAPQFGDAININSNSNNIAINSSHRKSNGNQNMNTINSAEHKYSNEIKVIPSNECERPLSIMNGTLLKLPLNQPLLHQVKIKLFCDKQDILQETNRSSSSSTIPSNLKNSNPLQQQQKYHQDILNVLPQNNNQSQIYGTMVQKSQVRNSYPQSLMNYQQQQSINEQQLKAAENNLKQALLENEKYRQSMSNAEMGINNILEDNKKLHNLVESLQLKEEQLIQNDPQNVINADNRILLNENNKLIEMVQILENRISLIIQTKEDQEGEVIQNMTMEEEEEEEEPSIYKSKEVKELPIEMQKKDKELSINKEKIVPKEMEEEEKPSKHKSTELLINKAREVSMYINNTDEDEVCINKDQQSWIEQMRSGNQYQHPSVSTQEQVNLLYFF